MTSDKNVSRTNNTSKIRTRGMVKAYSRSGNRDKTGWPSSTNGCHIRREKKQPKVNRENDPRGVVTEHDSCDEQEHEPDRAIRDRCLRIR